MCLYFPFNSVAKLVLLPRRLLSKAVILPSFTDAIDCFTTQRTVSVQEGGVMTQTHALFFAGVRLTEIRTILGK